MLTIRLTRIGRKNDPSFRVVVVDSKKSSKAGSYVERIGSYNPKTKEQILNTERAQYWITKGAQPSDTVWNMLVVKGAVDGKKRNVLPAFVAPEVAAEPVVAPVEAEEVVAEAQDEVAADEPVPTPDEVLETQTAEAPVEETKNEA